MPMNRSISSTTGTKFWSLARENQILMLALILTGGSDAHRNFRQLWRCWSPETEILVLHIPEKVTFRNGRSVTFSCLSMYGNCQCNGDVPSSPAFASRWLLSVSVIACAFGSRKKAIFIYDVHSYLGREGHLLPNPVESVAEAPSLRCSFSWRLFVRALSLASVGSLIGNGIIHPIGYQPLGSPNIVFVSKIVPGSARLNLCPSPWRVWVKIALLLFCSIALAKLIIWDGGISVAKFLPMMPT